MNFALKLTKLVNTASILVKPAAIILQSSTHLYASKSRHMQPTMTPTMTPGNAHLDIPGNPSTAKSSIQRLNDRSGGAPLKVLSEYDWGFWQHDGFVVIRSAVPKEQVQRLAKFLWEFEEKDPGDPATWYTPPRAEMQMKELTNTGMVEVYNHQYLWDNRQTELKFNGDGSIQPVTAYK